MINWCLGWLIDVWVPVPRDGNMDQSSKCTISFKGHVNKLKNTRKGSNIMAHSMNNSPRIQKNKHGDKWPMIFFVLFFAPTSCSSCASSINTAHSWWELTLAYRKLTLKVSIFSTQLVDFNFKINLFTCLQMKLAIFFLLCSVSLSLQQFYYPGHHDYRMAYFYPRSPYSYYQPIAESPAVNYLHSYIILKDTLF